MKRFLFVFTAAVSVGAPVVYAQRDRGPFDGYGFVSSYYDNNVFSYSDVDRDLYESGATANGRFPIASLEDVVTTLALRGDYRWDIESRSMWRARLAYDGIFYANNGDRTYGQYGAMLERIMRSSRASLAVDYTPDFYLRHLYWRPMPERPAGVRYAPAVYDRWTVTANGIKRLSDTVDGVAMIGYARRDYDFPFNERDNNTYSARGGINLEISQSVSASLGVSANISMASGADSTNPAVDDISNNLYGIDAAAAWRMTGWLHFRQSIEYGHQVYQTSNPADATHFDRRDDEFTLTSQFTMEPARGWQPELFFQYRDSNTTTVPGVVEGGQYEAFRTGLQVTYYF